LFTRESANPSRDALILLVALGMGLPVENLDEVLLAADYKPLALAASLRSISRGGLTGQPHSISKYAWAVEIVSVITDDLQLRFGKRTTSRLTRQLFLQG
jgi:hypothetical protein